MLGGLASAGLILINFRSTGGRHRHLPPARCELSETADSRLAFPLADAAACVSDDQASTNLSKGDGMARFSMQKNHTPPMPGPDVLPLPLDPDKGPTPDLLPDDPDRDGVTQPVGREGKLSQ